MRCRAGQAALGAPEAADSYGYVLLRMAGGPVLDALQQLWDVLRLVPANYRRLQIACCPTADAPGATSCIGS